MLNTIYDKPLATKGLISYRYLSYRGRYIMIGAKDNRDALKEANRSLPRKNALLTKLEIWDNESSAYRKVVATNNPKE